MAIFSAAPLMIESYRHRSISEASDSGHSRKGSRALRHSSRSHTTAGCGRVPRSNTRRSGGILKRGRSRPAISSSPAVRALVLLAVARIVVSTMRATSTASITKAAIEQHRSLSAETVVVLRLRAYDLRRETHGDRRARDTPSRRAGGSRREYEVAGIACIRSAVPWRAGARLPYSSGPGANGGDAANRGSGLPEPVPRLSVVAPRNGRKGKPRRRRHNADKGFGSWLTADTSPACGNPGDRAVRSVPKKLIA